MADVLDCDYGPLRGLIGTWKGDKGLDVSPEPDGTEENPYYETIVVEAAGSVANAESQLITMLRYHQVVMRKSNDEVFHDQVGYWMWDTAQSLVVQSVAIPRAVCVLAGTKFEGNPTSMPVSFQVRAELGHEDWGILQSPFMRDNARTTAFEHELRIDGDKLWYAETTKLEIYGRSFDHTDTNELTRE